MKRIAIALSVLLLVTIASDAHYNMLLPSKPWAEKGEKITFTYQFGHPFEHELFDAPEPKFVFAILPDNKTQKIEKLTKRSVPGADGKKVTAFSFVYEPATRGDHTLVLHTPPIWMEETKGFVQDHVKVVLHVQTQKNWDASIPRDITQHAQRHVFTLVPLTRPYGLLPGMIFQANVGLFPSGNEHRAPSRPVEIERYNPVPPKKLPPDELVTFKTKTDTNGVVTFAFPDPGWWSITATGPREFAKNWKDGGKEGPAVERATLWVHVDEKK